MRLLYSSYALTIGAALALLGGCGGSQPPIGATGTMPQSRAINLRAPNGTYLYVADNGYGVVYVYKKFPRTKKKAARIIRDLRPYGLCSDKDGNVFVTGISTSGSEILEYSHGGTTPIASLADSPTSSEPAGCAVDQPTENLAVANVLTHRLSSSGNVLIYNGAQGTPTVYTDPDINQPLWCTYDNAGNLYVVGVNTHTEDVVYAVLRKRSAGLVDLNISGLNPHLFGGIAWDGKYLTVFGDVSGSDLLKIYQVKISGSSGKVVNKISLDGFRIGGGMVIYNGQVLLPVDGHLVLRWPYPAGGEPKGLRQFTGDFVSDEAISAAPQKK